MENNAALLIMKESDNIAIAIRLIEAGETVSDTTRQVSVVTTEKIPFGFKVAIQEIAKDGLVYKYGEPIGKGIETISKGQLVHVHNIVGLRGRGDLE
jgi:altronate dehydratase small subunit